MAWFMRFADDGGLGRLRRQEAVDDGGIAAVAGGDFEGRSSDAFDGGGVSTGGQ